VAHSAGGVVGCQLLAQAPERVHGFLGISALIPPGLANDRTRLAYRVVETFKPESQHLPQGLVSLLDEFLPAN